MSIRRFLFMDTSHKFSDSERCINDLINLIHNIECTEVGYQLFKLSVSLDCIRSSTSIFTIHYFTITNNFIPFIWSEFKNCICKICNTSESIIEFTVLTLGAIAGMDQRSFLNRFYMIIPSLHSKLPNSTFRGIQNRQNFLIPRSLQRQFVSFYIRVAKIFLGISKVRIPNWNIYPYNNLVCSFCLASGEY